MPAIIVTQNISVWDMLKSIFQLLLFCTALIAIFAVQGSQQRIELLERALAEKSLVVHKSQVTNLIKQCEALRESTNGYHAGKWRIEVNDKGTRVECVQEGYRIPR
jgi:hypothetical protein